MNRLITGLLVLICLSAVSCKKHDGDNPAALAGTWSGTFQRILGSTGPKSHVTLTFQNGKFTGTTDSLHYPGICQGAYSAPAADTIAFTNACFWTADFDWSLILGGTYGFKQNGDRITITRVYPGIVYEADIYELQKNN